MESIKGFVLSGFQLCLANGRYLHKVREWDKIGTMVFIPLNHLLPGSLNHCSSQCSSCCQVASPSAALSGAW